jgi:serine/threonine protein kinase
VGEDHDTSFLVMQYLEGETLESRLETGALAVDEALKIAIQIADALTTAHRAAIVHRNLKPGNIFLVRSRGRSSDSPDAKLLDFGLAKSSAPAVAAAALSVLPTTLTAQGTILGTFQYMAPEQLEGKDADTRSDIFAFGAVVYEMVTGKKAFEGKTQASLIHAIMGIDPPLISKVQPLAPAALDRVVKKCLAKDADARWQSVRDLQDELQWVSESASQAVVSTPVVAQRRNRLAWTVATASLIVAVLAVATTLYVRRAAPEPLVTRLVNGHSRFRMQACWPIAAEGQIVASSSGSTETERRWMSSRPLTTRQSPIQSSHAMIIEWASLASCGRSGRVADHRGAQLERGPEEITRIAGRDGRIKP